MLNIRDQLTSQIMGLRQPIRDMPEEELPQVKVMLEQFEKELQARATKRKGVK